jgi:hypothetical protein
MAAELGDTGSGLTRIDSSTAVLASSGSLRKGAQLRSLVSTGATHRYPQSPASTTLASRDRPAAGANTRRQAISR